MATNNDKTTDAKVALEQQSESREDDDQETIEEAGQSPSASDQDDDRGVTFWKRLTSSERPEAALVAIRVGTSLGIASLFTFVPDVDDPWPESYWVYVTAGVVSWLLDTGNVAKKTIQRILGTIVGCTLGLGVGFLSLQIGDQGSQVQGIFLGLVVTLFGFLYPYVIFKCGYFSTYGSALATITFGLVVLVWYDPDNEDPWEVGLWRVVNIIIGSVIAAACSLLVFPLSTKDLIQSKVDALVQQTGEATKAVFDAAADISEGLRATPPSLWDLVQKDEDEDEAHRLYIASVNETRAIKALFPTLEYDLNYHRLKNPTAFIEYMRLLLGKMFRMQIAIIMLDTIIRANLHRGDSMTDLTHVLRMAGARISEIHDRSLEQEAHEQALHELIHVHLPRVRQHLLYLGQNNDLEELGGDDLMDTLLTQSTHRLAHLEGPGQSTLFWRIVEHIILRTVRFHGFCVEYESAVAFSSSTTPHTRPSLAIHIS